MGELAEFFRSGLDAYNRRDKDAWLDFADPEIENHPPREWPESSVTKGPEAVWDFLVQNFETFDAGDVELAGPIEEGDDAVLAPLRADVRGQASGVEVEWAYFQVTTVRDGKATKMAWFGDRDEAREAAGLA
jgi:ketosteroid isomerase-like protein